MGRTTGIVVGHAQQRMGQSTVGTASTMIKGANTIMVERAVALQAGRANPVAAVWHQTFGIGEAIPTMKDGSPHAPPQVETAEERTTNTDLA